MKASAIVLLAALSVLLAASAPAGAVVPRDLALRLTDLDPGFAVEDETCDPTRLYDDGPSRILKQIGARHHTDCAIGFWRVWKAPGTPASPLRVSSYAFVFDNTDGPEAALTRPRAVVTYLSGDALEVVPPAPAIGDEAVLLHGDMQRVGRRSWWSATVLWRSGNVLAAVRTISQRSADVSTQAALRLAAVQQARIASPTPLGPNDNDDAEVGLDAPDLRVPIYWLGHDLAARGRLPGLTLHLSLALRFRGIEAVYLGYGRDDELVVTLMQPSILRLPIVRRDLRRLAHDPCTRRERVALPSGHATIWSKRGRRCRVRAEDTFAIARMPGVIVVLGQDSERRSVTRYATRAGMLRLLRALRLRQPSAAP
ncbi:MAG TPA: hypothetical protein VKB25_02200 [Conexibacter sp.]|nr:hypothetical protein [Conexibacter sp.]